MSSLPPLKPGDRLDRKIFHARYEAMPPGTRAELIGGIVFMPPPSKTSHGLRHGRSIHWLISYQDATPNTEALDNTSTLLDDEAEPQPDGCLLITAAGHGQTREEDEYIVGPPELALEIAASSVAIDMHLKRADYERTGVREYIVVILRQQRVVWFVSRDRKFQEMQPGLDGIYRSEVFPGLWLDPTALLNNDGVRVTQVLNRGLASPEHAAFVARLAAPPAAP